LELLHGGFKPVVLFPELAGFGGPAGVFKMHGEGEQMGEGFLMCFAT
jgi:hypothetical protein